MTLLTLALVFIAGLLCGSLGSAAVLELLFAYGERQTDTVERTQRSDCPDCDDGGCVIEAPEAGYATCTECGERGYWREEGTEWWRNDPDSMWYVDTSSQEVYLASAGITYEPAYDRAIFDSEEKAEDWLDSLEPDIVGSYDWSNVERFVINETENEQ